MLTILQSAELKRGVVSVDYLTLCKEIFKNYEPFKEMYDGLVVQVTDMQTHAAEKEKNAKPKTETKEAVKRRAAHDTSIYLGLTEEYYKKVKNTEMVKTIHKSESDLYEIKDPEFSLQIDKIIKDTFTTELMDNVVFKKYGITQEKLAAITVDTVLFESLISNKKTTTIDTSLANNALNASIKGVHETYNSMDNLIGYFEKTESDFVDGYYLATELEIKGYRNTGTDGIFLKNDLPVKNGSVRIVDTDKVTTTDSKGYFIFIHLRPGTYQLQASTEGGDVVILTVVVRRGHITTVEFKI